MKMIIVFILLTLLQSSWAQTQKKLMNVNVAIAGIPLASNAGTSMTFSLIQDPDGTIKSINVVTFANDKISRSLWNEISSMTGGDDEDEDDEDDKKDTKSTQKKSGLAVNTPLLEKNIDINCDKSGLFTDTVDLQMITMVFDEFSNEQGGKIDLMFVTDMENDKVGKVTINVVKRDAGSPFTAYVMNKTPKWQSFGSMIINMSTSGIGAALKDQDFENIQVKVKDINFTGLTSAQKPLTFMADEINEKEEP